MSLGKLTLKRFNGIEEFEISEAEITAWKSEGSVALNLEIHTGKAIATVPDTKDSGILPNAEITIHLESLNPDQLVGQSFFIENGMDEEENEWNARFYYFEHENIDKNTITFISKSTNLFKIVWTGFTQDVNYYDGSKPDTEISIEANFNFSELFEWQQ
jgi:hypothetical protein